MQWKRLGKIFDPTEHKLFDGCFAFAKSPQALVFDDFVRIYFSTVKVDGSGKYLSHVAFVDFDKKFQNIITVSENEVIALGELGCFDEHGIFPFNVLKVEDKIFAYTSGWSRRVSTSVETAIGFASSTDGGISFQKNAKGSIMSASLQEPFLVVDAFVKHYDGIYHMWYIFGTQWKNYGENKRAERIYKIAHATSDDGINYQRDAKQIIQEKFQDESQALPSVIKIANRYHMYFCYRKSNDFRNNAENAYKIGYAYSDDMIHWTRDDSKFEMGIPLQSWDSDMQCYPNVFEMDNEVYMLYNGNEFGKYGFGLAKLKSGDDD